jgi:hypothetical protein
LLGLDILPSARKHKLLDPDIAHAVEFAVVIYELENDDGPRRCLHLGPDRSGNLFEVIALDMDDGRLLVIHAMPMRPIYDDLLP